MNLVDNLLLFYCAGIEETDPSLFSIASYPDRLQTHASMSKCLWPKKMCNPLLKSDKTSFLVDLTFVIETKWHMFVLISVLTWHCYCPLLALLKALPLGSLLLSFQVKLVLISAHGVCSTAVGPDAALLDSLSDLSLGTGSGCFRNI